MKIYLDFTLYHSPTSAYGNVTGFIDLLALPQVNDDIVLLNTLGDEYLPFRGSLKVTSTGPAAAGLGADASVILEDVVLSSTSAAESLSTLLENEAGLSCDSY
ncbi:hypothetical protein JCM19000A_05690 [Silvimonas sp. JCM 19000]